MLDQDRRNLLVQLSLYLRHLPRELSYRVPHGTCNGLKATLIGRDLPRKSGRRPHLDEVADNLAPAYLRGMK